MTILIDSFETDLKERLTVWAGLYHKPDFENIFGTCLLELPDFATRKAYNSALGANLKNAHSDKSQRLPIPATFIIDQNRTILWRHFDTNYKNRAAVSDILNALSQ